MQFTEYLTKDSYEDLDSTINLLGVGDDIQKNNDTVFFTYGRFQPPTIGHGYLFETINNGIIKNGNSADGYVFVSHSQNVSYSKLQKKKIVKELRTYPEYTRINELINHKDIRNPLSTEQKVYFLQKFFTELFYKNIKIINTTECIIVNKNLEEQDLTYCKGFIPILYKLINTGYKNINFVVGSDRYDDFEKILEGLKHEKIVSGKVKINIIKAGNDRTTDSISGTYMRHAALLKNIPNFMLGIPMKNDYESILSIEEVIYLMNELNKGMGLDGFKFPIELPLDLYRTKNSNRPVSPTDTGLEYQFGNIGSPGSPGSLGKQITRTISSPGSPKLSLDKYDEELTDKLDDLLQKKIHRDELRRNYYMRKTSPVKEKSQVTEEDLLDMFKNIAIIKKQDQDKLTRKDILQGKTKTIKQKKQEKLKSIANKTRKIRRENITKKRSDIKNNIKYNLQFRGNKEIMEGGKRKSKTRKSNKKHNKKVTRRI
jgi:hypothetical protein